jgi:hypothetical protein
MSPVRSTHEAHAGQLLSQVARPDYSLEREIEQATARLYPSGYGFKEEVGY